MILRIYGKGIWTCECHVVLFPWKLNAKYRHLTYCQCCQILSHHQNDRHLFFFSSSSNSSSLENSWWGFPATYKFLPGWHLDWNLIICQLLISNHAIWKLQYCSDWFNNASVSVQLVWLDRYKQIHMLDQIWLHCAVWKELTHLWQYFITWPK